MLWFKIRYRLPVNDGPKPETCVYKAETVAEAKQRLVDYYEKRCHGIYGVPEIVSTEPYDSWEHVKESFGR